MSSDAELTEATKQLDGNILRLILTGDALMGVRSMRIKNKSFNALD